MAGIGFEIKKLFKKEGIFNTVFAGLHATAVTIGPMVIVIIALNVMYMMQPYIELAYKEKEVLSSTILYVFIFSMILVSPVNIILSRYIADRIYEEDYSAIYTAVGTGELIIALCVAASGIPFGYMMYTKGNLPVYYIFTAYVFFAGVSFTFYYMNFITVLKQYSKITYSFFGSLIVGVLFVTVSNKIFDLNISDAILFGLTISFTMIAVFLVTFLKLSFREREYNYNLLIRCLKKNILLVLANFLYILGLYIHNFVFWSESDYKVVVKNIFVSAPNYDMATYLAMLSNISVLVIFTVNVETKFHTAYKAYCETIIGAAGKDMKKAKQKMIETLRRETIYIIQLQIIVNLTAYIVAQVFFPRLGVEGDILSMYPALSVGYMIIYLIQCLMIYLFYLDDMTGAVMTGAVFLLSTFLGSMVSVHFSVYMSGLGLVFGSICGMSMAFFRLRYKLIHLDRHIYGKGRIVKKVMKEKKKDIVTVYSFSKSNKGGDSY